MKKILIAAFLVFSAAMQCVSAKANEKNALLFEPAGGGKFIYCNNPEELVREDLADDGETPEFLMNCNDLGADNYRLYLSHFNRVAKVDTGETYPGEDIWFDAVFTAREDCEISIFRTAFEVPENITTYLNFETIQTENSWSALFACADLIEKPIYTLNTDKVFAPTEQSVKTLLLKKGESFFLSEYTEGFSAVPYPKHVLMAADFEINSGSVDIGIFAAKDRKEDETGVSYPNVDFENCGFGIYKRGRTQKGIADSLPEMRVDLEYEIGDYTKDGAYLPVTVYNSRKPDGIPVTEWITNLNPQDDTYSVNNAAECDLLPMYYEDESKLSYYGENIPKNERDTVWRFDTAHSDTLEYPGDECGVSAEDYRPNYLLDTAKNNIGYACSMGNYGVTLKYNVKVTNNGTADRYFDYTVSTAANIIVEVTDKDGNDLQPVISKGQTNSITEDVMASIPIKAGGTTEFSIAMTLPVQNYGGQKQSFRVRGEKSELNFKKSGQIKPILAEDNILAEYKIAELLENADERTKFLLKGNLDCLDVVKTDSGFAGYFKTTAANPWGYGYYWQITGRIFIFDDGFNIVKEIYPGSQPIEMTFSDGRVYVKTIANGSFYIGENFELVPYDSYILPRDNGIAKINAKDGRLTVSEDGENYYKVAFQGKDVPFAQISGNVFLWATDSGAGVSKNGIYWRSVERDIGKITAGDGFITVDGDKLSAPGADAPKVRVNDEFLAFDTLPIVKDDKIFVPMRFIFEKLGMMVFFDGDEGRITAVGKNAFAELEIGSELAAVNGETVKTDAAEIIGGRTYVPLRFVSESCGYDVDWLPEKKTAVITGQAEPISGDIELLGRITPIFFAETEISISE